MPEPLLQEPAAVFLTIMAVIFIAPLLSERARLPGIVGLILGGILIGAHVLNLLSVGQVIELFGVIGLIYLMVNAGQEIDLDQFQSVHRRAFVFASLLVLAVIVGSQEQSFSFAFLGQLVVLPSMGSHARFSTGSEPLTSKLFERLDSSLAIIHFP